MKHRPPYSRRGEQAILAAQEAAIADTMPRTEVGDDEVYAAQARLARARHELCLTPAEPASVSAGEAVSWENQSDEPRAGAHARIIDTLEHPTSISVGASQDRTSAALGVGILEAAVDAAVSAQASNSIEKMLCHQLAAAHFAAMRLLERTSTTTLPPVEATRVTNAAARMMDVFQSGCLALQKVKTGGQQRVLVQYQQVNVAEGGHALVAGGVHRGSGRGRVDRDGE